MLPGGSIRKSANCSGGNHLFGCKRHSLTISLAVSKLENPPEESHLCTLTRSVGLAISNPQLVSARSASIMESIASLNYSRSFTGRILVEISFHKKRVEENGQQPFCFAEEDNFKLGCRANKTTPHGEPQGTTKLSEKKAMDICFDR
jgi:hypothetical protein